MNRRNLLILGLLVLSFTTESATLFGTEESFLREGSRHFRERSGYYANWFTISFFIFLVALISGIIFYDFYVRRRAKIGIDNPHYLLAELVRAHGLTRMEKHFLVDFAALSDLEDPLHLFIEPKFFLSALDDNRFRVSHPTIEHLLKKLFGIENRDTLPARRLEEKSSQLYIERTTIVLPSRANDNH